MDWASVLQLPPATLAGSKTITKTMLTSLGGLSKAEAKLLRHLARLTHLASVQRSSTHIAPVTDGVHDIASIIYLRCELTRAGGATAELAATLHRAFPNPAVLLFEAPGGQVGISVSIKRRSLSEKGAVVVERTESLLHFDPELAAYASYLADIRYTVLPQTDLLAYATAFCERTAKAAAIAAVGEYPRCPDTSTPTLMRLLAQLKGVQMEINALGVRYRDREASLAETARLRMDINTKERERDAIAGEIKKLCHD